MKQLSNETNNKSDKIWIKKIEELIVEITTHLENYQFNLAAELLYEFIWHEFADKYIEDVKNRINENSFLVLSSLFKVQLKLLHPFMPFVTEEIYQQLNELAPRSHDGAGGIAKNKKSIMIEPWPSA